MFKSLQVVRTKVEKRVKDFRLKPGTRVVVVNVKDGVVTARCADEAVNEGAWGLHMTFAPDQLEPTRRGRPTKAEIEARTSKPRTSSK